MIWRGRNFSLDFSDGRSRLMGILNVTPDSFSDGGSCTSPKTAKERALAMVEAGAEIIDVGGESTRPGSAPVPLDEELRRVIPAVEALHALRSTLNAPRFFISVDTTKAEVARRALEVGAHIVNDISACRFDPAMPGVVARAGAGLVLMHMQGTPQTMQRDPRYDDVTSEVVRFLGDRMTVAKAAGIAAEQIAVDPGIGFGKTVEHNLELLRHLAGVGSFGRPILVGLSRKSFLAGILGPDAARADALLQASVAAAVWAVVGGANIVRVHDVAETARALRVIDELRKVGQASCLSGHDEKPFSRSPCRQQMDRQDACPTMADTHDTTSTFVPFDAGSPVQATSRHLPHWQQGGCAYFVTFRLADAVAEDKQQQWKAEQKQWLVSHPEPWSEAVRAEYHHLFTGQMQQWLDAGHGACWLRDPAMAALVAGALAHFHGSRYALDDFVVMPNHVHVLVTPLKEHELSEILHSWKSFTAKQINHALGHAGAVWQDESFDHVVRSAAQLERFRDYIRNNPVAAHLREGEYSLGQGAR